MTIPGPAPIATRIRAPRSPSPWRASAIPCRARKAWKVGWVSSGAAHSVTGPQPASQAVATARSIKRACSAAAPAAPSTGTSLVLAKPASGALASTAIATGSLITVLLRELLRVGAEEIGEPQPPHQQDGREHAVVVPAPARGHDPFGETKRLAHALEALAERDVLHQRDLGEAANLLEGVAAHEDRLVAGRDPGEARAQAHEESDHQQERGAAVDPDVETPPRAARALEPVDHDTVGVGRQGGVGVQEQEHIAGGFGGAGIHLQRAAARRGDDAVGAQPSALDGGVTAAAVDHDQLGAERAQIAQRIERRGDRLAF